MKACDLADQARGWFSHAEGEVLAKLATDHYCLELGSFAGKSTIYLASTAKLVIAVDTFKSHEGGKEQLGEISTLMEFHNNLKPFNNVISITAPGSVIAPFMKDASFDLIFIDANHEHEAARADIISWLPKVKKNGIMAFHDYGPSLGVKPAVDELLGDDLLGYVDTLAWLVVNK